MSKSRRRRWTDGSAAALVSGGLLVLAGCAASEAADPAARPAQTAGPGATAAPGDRLGIVASLPDTVERVEPSVVTIFTDRGVGSGVVYNADGVIVTNAHVVAGREQVEVGLADGSRIPAQVVALDEVTDLAVVRVERKGLPAARFQQELPRPGELVLAMGSPLGFANSVTVGVVSGLSREIPGSATQTRSLVDLIQTDAAISPGNSGGALVDADGEVVGINEAYIPPAVGAVSLGFAIPAATVVDVVEELLADGTATHSFLGLQLGRLTPNIAEQFDLPADRGVVVLDVVAGGPGAAAGIGAGDVIVTLAGELVASYEDLLGKLRGTEPGQRLDVVVNRDGKELTLPLVIGERPAQ